MKNSILRLSLSSLRRPATRTLCQARRPCLALYEKHELLRTLQTSPDCPQASVQTQPQSAEDFSTKSPGQGDPPLYPRATTAISSTLAASLTCCLLLLLTACAPPRSSHIVVGAKNFTEQVVLGELVAQEIEAVTGQRVERRFYLAGSYLCQQALVSGRIDAYVEYTGTALTAILKQPLPPVGQRDAARVFSEVSNLYAQRYHVKVEPGLGFEDTFAMVVRGADAQRMGLKTISDALKVALQWRLGVGYEFESRPDGLPGLEAAYGLKFAGAPRTMDLGLLYRALAAGQVDMVAGNSTDGPIRALGFQVLADDKHYFPPYEAVPLIREDSLRRWPAIQTAMDKLAGKVSAEEVQTMNDAVDGKHLDVANVVREFRVREGL